MLVIDERQLGALGRANTHKLAPRLDAWLLEKLPGWPAVDAAIRRRELADLIDLGMASGFDAESDYAVFAWLCFGRGSNWRNWTAEKDVKATLSAAEWSPQAKLLALEEMAQGRTRP